MIKNGVCHACGGNRTEMTGDLMWCADCGELLADTQARTHISMGIADTFAPSPRSGRKCSIPGCNESHHGLGLCYIHYNRMRTGRL